MQTIRVETVGYQAALAIDLSEEGVPVRSYHTGKEKFDPEVGVNTLAVLMEMGKLVIPSDATDALAAVIAKVHDGRVYAEQTGWEGQKRFLSHFSFDRMIDRYAQMYRELQVMET